MIVYHHNPRKAKTHSRTLELKDNLRLAVYSEDLPRTVEIYPLDAFASPVSLFLPIKHMDREQKVVA